MTKIPIKTALYELHLELGAKMDDFAGFTMPVHYPHGIVTEHNHTRAKAGLFDISHKGQVLVQGVNPCLAFERLVPADIVGLEPLSQTYTVFTNAQGGILDDLQVCNTGNGLMVIVSAACINQDIELMQQGLPECDVIPCTNRALLALQGPEAAEVMARLAPEAPKMRFMDWRPLRIEGVDCYVGRTSFTGEDGFEISLPADSAIYVARLLLDQAEVEPIGLGARDSLRLEAGFCLYGFDLDNTTTPIEANLQYALQSTRLPYGKRAGGYPGAEVIADQFENGVTRQRVGLIAEGKAPVRQGSELIDSAGNYAGIVTSGSFGATLSSPVAMAYVSQEYASEGTKLKAIVRGREISVVASRVPFVPQRFHFDYNT